MGSPDGSLPTLKGQDTALARWRRKSTRFTHRYRSSCKTRLGMKIASRRLLRPTAQTTKITNFGSRFILWQDSIIPELRFLLMLPATGYSVWFLLLLDALDGDRALFRHHHGFYYALQGGMVVAPSFLKACDVLLEIFGALSDLSSPGKGADNPNLLAVKKLFDRNNISCLQKVHGRNFVYFVPFFLTMKMREDRLSAFIGIFHLKRLL